MATMPTQMQAQRGYVLLWAMFFVAAVLTHVTVSMTQAAAEILAVHAYIEKQRTFHAAESLVDHAIAEVKRQVTAAGQYPAVLQAIAPPVLPGTPVGALSVQRFAVSYVGQPDEGPVNPAIEGLARFQGMTALAQDVRIVADIASSRGPATRLVQVVTFHLIPIYQFAVFDWNDWTFRPGPLALINGPIHANGSIGLGPASGLTIDGTVTTAEHFVHLEPRNGFVRIADADGDFQHMQVGGEWLESTDANWETESVARWDGRVQAHAAPIQLPLPLDASGQPIDPIEVIRPGTAADPPELIGVRYYHRAGLRITNTGSAVDASGAPVVLPAGTVSCATFFDAREGQNMSVTQIDVGVLSVAAPANRIVYVDANQLGCGSAGVRLVNGEQLPAGGLSVATNKPLYIQGDFNTQTKQPASVAADAVTVLSNAWTDADSTQVTGNRDATSTTVNAALMAGRAWQVEEAALAGDYPFLDHGVASEHLIRFLEDWSGQTFTFVGSEISPWDSDLASSALACCGSLGAYSPPQRIWVFDTSFLGGLQALPPGTPNIHVTVGTVWQDCGDATHPGCED